MKATAGRRARLPPDVSQRKRFWEVSWKGRACEKSEIRSPKSERNPKPEIRMERRHRTHLDAAPMHCRRTPSPASEGYVFSVPAALNAWSPGFSRLRFRPGPVPQYLGRSAG